MAINHYVVPVQSGLSSELCSYVISRPIQLCFFAPGIYIITRAKTISTFFGHFVYTFFVVKNARTQGFFTRKKSYVYTLFLLFVFGRFSILFITKRKDVANTGDMPQILPCIFGCAFSVDVPFCPKY